MITNVTPITIQDLLGEVTRLKIDGFRLVTLSGIATGPDQVEILYHFDKDLTLAHLRLTAARESAVPSISPIYMAAFLAENEIQDLFHIRFHGLVIDYGRTLLLCREALGFPAGGGRPVNKSHAEPDTQTAPSRGAS